MKKLLLTLSVSSLLFCSSTYAYLSGGGTVLDTELKKSAINYAYLYVKGIPPLTKDYDKALETLEAFKDNDSAKLLLAYCYYKRGNDGDAEKIDDLFLRIDSNLDSYNSSFFYDIINNDIAFILKMSDALYARTNDLKKSYSIFFNYNKLIALKKDYKDDYDRIVKIAESDPNYYASALFNIYSNDGNIEGVVDLLKFVDSPNRITQYQLNDLFIKLLNENKPEYVKDIIACNERASSSKDVFAFPLAYCYEVGFGVEKNEQLADEYLKIATTTPSDAKYSFVYNLLSNKELTKNLKDFCYEYSKSIFDKGYPELYIRCLTMNSKNKTDLPKTVDALFNVLNKYPDKLNDSLENYFKYYILYFEKYKSLDEQRKTKLFKVLEYINSKDDFVFGTYNIFYYDFLINGVGVEADGKKAFDALVKLNDSKKCENFNLFKCMLLEYIAYCYDNGIGTEKDTKKASELRDEICTIAYKNIDQSNAIFSTLLNFYSRLYYPYRKNILVMTKYYGEKVSQSRELAFKSKLVDSDKKLFNEFISIENDFKANKNLENIDKRVAQLFNTLMDTKSYLVDEIAIEILDNNDAFITSRKLKEIAMPYLKKIADSFKPNLYIRIAESYRDGDLSAKELALDCYIKSADYYTNKIQNLSNLYSATYLAESIKDSKRYIEIMAKIDSLNPEHNVQYTISKAKAYLVEDKQYRNEAEAKKLLDNALNTTESPEDLKLYLANSRSSVHYDIIFGYYAFKFALKLEKTGDKSYEPYVTETIIDSYRYGVVVQKDVEKAVDYFINYVYEDRNSTNYELDFLLWLFKDVEDSNPQLLNKVLEKGVQRNSKIAKFVKGFAVLEGFGYEKDESANQEFYKFLANNLKLTYDNFSTYSDVLNISKDTYQNILNNMEFNGKHAYEFSNFNHKAGNVEEAIKYGYIQGKKASSTNMGISLDLFYKTRPTEEIAEFVSTSNKAFMQLVYADLLYKGDGVKQDKKKAFDIVENLFEKYNYVTYKSSYFVWLHNHYKLENRQDKIEKLLAYCNMYSYYDISSFATLYADNEKFSIMYSPLVGNDMKSAKELLELSETQYFNKGFENLISLYGNNIYLKNLDKKREISNKAKKYVDDFLEK